MVYLFPPGSTTPTLGRTEVPPGLPLWYLTRADRTLQDLRRRGERLPPDRRYLKAWARAVRPLEVNIEVSDLGTVLQARYRMPEGIWLLGRFEQEAKGEEPVREERLWCVRDPPPAGFEMALGTVRFHMHVERQGQEEEA
ncbi:MAG: hypothetical protein KGI98_06580 [Euryarchaeota archaeon]|nr:hypothetical protein [Euryarchaeota archaeon]